VLSQGQRSSAFFKGEIQQAVDVQDQSGALMPNLFVSDLSPLPEKCKGAVLETGVQSVCVLTAF